MSKSINHITDKEYSKMAKDLEYQMYYNRWPIADPESRQEPIEELFHTAWIQYSKILGNGEGLNSILTIQKQIDFEIKEIKENLNEFPDDADIIYKKRLKRNLTLLHIRQTTLRKLITRFSIQGKIEGIPEFELSVIHEMALNIVCKGKRVPYKREVLERYLEIHFTDKSKNVQDICTILEEDYDKLSYSSFAEWVKYLNREIERITLLQKSS